MQIIRIKKSIITKVDANLAKEYATNANYNDWLLDLWRDDAPYDAVEEYLINNGVMDRRYDLEDYVSASDYITMMKIARINRTKYFVATDFEANFTDWYIAELKERLQYYGFDLNAPVDVEAMVDMAESEKKKGR